ncbi:MAG: hypothetical protein E7290_10185 [Lachnospiraceae bacterium]|nr:hypothetical protein [Lachnospiraceae bacterium]
MKKKLIFSVITTLVITMLTGCNSLVSVEEVKTSRITKKTQGAIKANDTNSIELLGGNLLLNNNYRVAVSENEAAEVTTYFVWNPTKANEIADKKDGREGNDYEEAMREAWEKAKALAEEQAKKAWNKDKDMTSHLGESFEFDKDAYITPYNENVVMYIYSGLDRLSPAIELTDAQIKSSIQNYVQNYVVPSTSLSNTMYDSYSVPQVMENPLYPELSDASLNGDYYVMTFTGVSGQYTASTYGEYFYPRQYYGIWLLEKNVHDSSSRRWYGFIFTNDPAGDTMNEEAYADIMSQIKSEFGITRFYTDTYDTKAYNYDASKDYRNGRSYEQIQTLFSGTQNYYKMLNNTKSVSEDS